MNHLIPFLNNFSWLVMKNIFYILIFFSIASAIAASKTALVPNQLENEERFKSEREEYIRQMLLCEPGVDYNIIDFETRFAKYLNNKYLSNSTDSSKVNNNKLQSD